MGHKGTRTHLHLAFPKLSPKAILEMIYSQSASYMQYGGADHRTTVRSRG